MTSKAVSSPALITRWTLGTITPARSAMTPTKA